MFILVWIFNHCLTWFLKFIHICPNLDDLLISVSHNVLSYHQHLSRHSQHVKLVNIFRTFTKHPSFVFSAYCLGGGKLAGEKYSSFHFKCKISLFHCKTVRINVFITHKPSRSPKSLHKFWTQNRKNKMRLFFNSWNYTQRWHLQWKSIQIPLFNSFLFGLEKMVYLGWAQKIIFSGFIFIPFLSNARARLRE